MMSAGGDSFKSTELPPRYAALKKEIAALYGPNFEQNATRAWREITEELNKVADRIEVEGSNVRPALVDSKTLGVTLTFETRSTFLQWISRI